VGFMDLPRNFLRVNVASVSSDLKALYKSVIIIIRSTSGSQC